MSQRPASLKPQRPHAVEPAAAADELDAAVHQILQKLKEGKTVRLPGVGTLRPGPENSVEMTEILYRPAKGRCDGALKAQAQG
jgi:hypothetical protein